ncbi:MAG: O-antigen ligase family protein [Paracoccaceae bacterium]
MADLTAHITNAPREGLTHRLATLSYGLLAFVIFAGTRPFQGRHFQAVGMESQGSGKEALIYLVTTLACIGFCYGIKGIGLIQRSTMGLGLVLAYCTISVGWSDTQMTATVRLGQLVLVTVAVYAAMQALGFRYLIWVTYKILIAILILDYVSVMLIPGAVHGVGEVDTYPNHIESWKGVHIHKNYAGPVVAALCVVAAAFALNGRKWHLVVLALSTVFLLKTNSSASLIAAVVAVSGLVVIKGLARATGRAVTAYLVVLFLCMVGLTTPFYMPKITAFFADPYALTGRTELWGALVQYIQAYPWTGSGYGSFWRIGVQSPILYLTEGWAARTGQGHSGYLDTAAMLGVPGLAVVFAVFVLVPFALLLRGLTGYSRHYDLALALMIFVWVHNTVETSLLSPNHPVYLVALIGLCGVYQLRNRPPEEEVRDG